MASTFDDYLRNSKRANTPEAIARRAVFARSYSIASQLIDLRLKRKLTQMQLAELTGVAQSEISRIERGAVHPTDSTLTRLADAMDADLQIVARPVRRASAATPAPRRKNVAATN